METDDFSGKRRQQASDTACPSEEQIEIALVQNLPAEDPIWPHIFFCSRCEPVVRELSEELGLVFEALMTEKGRGKPVGASEDPNGQDPGTNREAS